MKEVIKPTYEELQQRVKDLESELEGRPELTFHPTPRVNSLRDYIDDPTPTNMFKCGQEYESKEQTASAIGFYHQCAERAIDDDLLAYEALLRMALCYEKQGGRKAHEKIALSHAISLIPNRPEAYLLLSQVYERQGNEDNHERWFDAYLFACMGESNDYNLATKIPNLQPLQTDVGYYGIHSCTYQRAVSAWWVGKCDEARELFTELNKREDFPNDIKTSILNNITKLKQNVGRQQE
tara:strand:- start:737 stop:1450 length:714 start_codon:yes stop_codon:yes gene_type:complete